jgi:hypothetical protein
MLRLARLAAALVALTSAGVAHATCRDTDAVLAGSGRLNVQIAELKNKVEQVAFGTDAAEALTVLRTAAEGFYDAVDAARHSCGSLRRRFDAVDAAGQDAVAQIELQGLTADDGINAALVDVRFGLYNVGLLVDQL